MIKKGSIFVALSFLLAFNPQEEMELLRSIFKNMNSQSIAADPEHMFYMSYSLNTFSVDTTEQPVSSTIEVWTKKQLVEIKNPQMKIFQDEKEAFVVLPAKHLIMRDDAAMLKNKNALGEKTLALYDSLLRYSHIVSSEKIKAKEYDKLISIEVNKKGQEMLGIRKADYCINSTKKTIKQVRMYYAIKSPQYNAKIAYVDYVINKIEYNYKGKTLHSNVASNFIANNKLKDSYKGYKLIDNRASVNIR